MKKFFILLLVLTMLSCTPNYLKNSYLSSGVSHTIIFKNGVILKTFPDTFEKVSTFQIIDYKEDVEKGSLYGGEKISLNFNGGIFSGKLVIEIPWVGTDVLIFFEHDGEIYQVDKKYFTKDMTCTIIDAKDLDKVVDNELKIYIFKTIGIKEREIEILGVGKKNSLKVFYEEQGVDLKKCEIVLDGSLQATLTKNTTTIEAIFSSLEPTLVTMQLLANVGNKQIIIDENKMVIRNEVEETFEEFFPVIYLEHGLKIVDLVSIFENNVFYHLGGYIPNPTIEDLIKYGSSKSLITVETFPDSSPVIYQETFRKNGKIFVNFWLFFEKDMKLSSSFFSIVFEESRPSYVILSQNDKKFKTTWDNIVKINDHPVIYVTQSGSFHQPTGKGIFLKPPNLSLNVPWKSYNVEKISSSEGIGLFCGGLSDETLPPFREESIETEKILNGSTVLTDSTKLVFGIETQYGFMEEKIIVPYDEKVKIRLSSKNFEIQDSKILWFSKGNLLGEGNEISAKFKNDTEIDVLVETQKGFIGFERFRLVTLERPSKPMLKVIRVSKNEVHLSWDCVDETVYFELQRKDLKDFYNICTTGDKCYIDKDIFQGAKYSYRVRAINYTLPSSWSNVEEVTIPFNKPPEIPHNPIPEDGAENVETNITLKWLSKDQDGDNLLFTIFLLSSNTEKIFQTHENQINLKNLEPHTKYFWRVKADDGEAVTWGSTWTFTTLNHVPKFFLEDQLVREGETLLIDLTEYAEDEDKDPLSFYLLSGPGELKDNFYIFTPSYDEAGIYEVTLKISDGFDEITGNFKVIVENVNRPPEVPKNPYPEDGAENILSSVTLKWDTKDPDGDKLTFDIVIESASGEFRKLLLTSSNMLSINLKGHTEYLWKVIAKDSEFCVEGPLWSFKTRNNLPKLSVDNVEIFEGETLVINLVNYASDTDGDALSFYLEKGPGVLENDKYYFTTDFDDAGVYEVILGVSDGFDNSTCTFYITVFDKNRPPNVPQPLFPKNNATDIDVSEVVLSWTCSDPDNDNLRYRVYFGEKELSFVEETSSTSLTIHNLKYGTTYFWKVIVLDEHGETAESETFLFSTRNWWARVFDVEGDDRFVKIEKIDDKLYLLGSRTINNEDRSSIAILSNEGDLLNIIDLGNFGPVYGFCKTNEGFVAVTYGIFDTHVLWLTKDLEISDVKVLEGITIGRTLFKLGNRYISVGSTINDKDGVVILIDEIGSVEIHKFDISKNMDEFSQAVLDDNGFTIVGTIFNEGYNILLVKLNEDLKIVWMKEFRESFNDFGKSLVKLDSGYLIVGKRFDAGKSCIYILKADDEREKIWERTVEFDASCFVESITRNESKTLIVGWRKNPHDGMIIDLAEEGDIVTKELGGNGYDFLYDVIPFDEGFLVLGSSDSWGEDMNIYLIKIDECGTFAEEPEVVTW